MTIEAKINDWWAPWGSYGLRTQMIDKPNKAQEEAETINVNQRMGTEKRVGLIRGTLEKDGVVAFTTSGGVTSGANPKSTALEIIEEVDRSLRLNHKIIAQLSLFKENEQVTVYIKEKE